MKLEVGKKYVCRNKPSIKYVRVECILPEEEKHGNSRVVVTRFYTDDQIHIAFCGIDGRYSGDYISVFDLVAEYVEPPFVVDKCGVYKQRDGKEKLVVGRNAHKCFVLLEGTHLGERDLKGRYDARLEEGTCIRDLVEYVRPLSDDDFKEQWRYI